MTPDDASPHAARLASLYQGISGGWSGAVNIPSEIQSPPFSTPYTFTVPTDDIDDFSYTQFLDSLFDAFNDTATSAGSEDGGSWLTGHTNREVLIAGQALISAETVFDDVWEGSAFYENEETGDLLFAGNTNYSEATNLLLQGWLDSVGSGFNLAALFAQTALAFGLIDEDGYAQTVAALTAENGEFANIFDYFGGDATSFNVELAAPDQDSVLGANQTGTVYAYGFEGNDSLTATAVGSRLLGGAGADTYHLKGEGVSVEETPDAGRDTVHLQIGDNSWTAYTLTANVEVAVVADDLGKFSLTGNASDNYLIGNSHANTLNGGEGQDILAGGAGNDTYILADISFAAGVADLVFEETGGGTDTVVARMQEYALPANVENLTMSSGSHGSHVVGKGNELDNNMVLIGTDVEGALYGYGGSDNLSSGANGGTLIGGTGNDQLVGSGKSDVFVYSRGDGHDTIIEQNDSTEFEDNLRFVDLHLDEVAFARTGNDLKVLTPSNGSVTVKDWFTPGQNRKIESVSFQDTTLSAQEVESRLASFVLTNDNDHYLATPGNDTVYGLDGDDTINGGSGSDTLYGGNGGDALWGGAGDFTDYLYGQEGIDRLYGEGGDDVMVGGNGTDFLDGGAGGDQMWGSADNDELWGQAGNDTIYGEGGSDKLYGGIGNDTLYGGEERDLLVGGADNDLLLGNAGSDQMWGGAGIDLLYGEAGDDSLYGEADNDLLTGGSGRNILVGGGGDDTFVANGTRDEMHGGDGFDTYLLTPVGQASVKLIFEDALGGRIDLSQYAQSGVGLTLLRNSQDQLILSRQSGGGETIAINGWSHQTLSLDLGGDVWSYSRVQQSLDAVYGYTYDKVYSASAFSTVVAGLSYTFNKAVNQYGTAEVNAAFTTGLTHGVATGITCEGSAVYRWGWKAGTLSDQAILEGAYYAETVTTLIENNRTRSSANIYVVPTVTDPHPVDRVDLWYDFWQSLTSGEWQFAVVEAYSADATTATFNTDGTITPSTEYNKVINEQDPATWELVRLARNNFELLAEQAISANFETQSVSLEMTTFAEPAAKQDGDSLLKAQPLLGASSGQEVVLQEDFSTQPIGYFLDNLQGLYLL